MIISEEKYMEATYAFITCLMETEEERNTSPRRIFDEASPFQQKCYLRATASIIRMAIPGVKIGGEPPEPESYKMAPMYELVDERYGVYVARWPDGIK